jgi:hypothetical protein
LLVLRECFREEDDDEGWSRGVYDVLKAETKAPPLRGCVDFAFSNKDKAAGVKEPGRFASRLALLFLILEEEEDIDDDDDEARLALRASNNSALLAAHSRSLLSDIRKGEDDGGCSIDSSRPDRTMGVLSILPHVVIGDSFPAPGMIWGVIATYDRRSDFCFL